jgi:diguanylate cyclase
MARSVRSRALVVYLAVTLPAITICYVLGDSWLSVVWSMIVGTAGAAGIVIGIGLNRPQAAAAWWLFAGAILLNSSGQGVEELVKNVVCPGCTGVIGLDTFPSVADAFYLGLYPGLIGGMLLLIRRRTRGRDWAAVLDATTISVGLGLLSWVFLIKPAAGDPTMGEFGHVVNVAYPAFDVIMLAMVVRLMLGAGTRNRAFQLIAASVLLFLGGDISWAVINQAAWDPGDVISRLLSMNFLLAYVLFGAAALHPSVREVAQPVAPKEARVSAPLLSALTAASLIAPGLLFLQAFRHQISNLIAIAAGSTVLFLLVVTRIAQVLRRVEDQARRLKELSLNDDLTGLPNRRAWTPALQNALEHARRHDTPLAVALLDLDHFKQFNDTFGHPAGDRLLKSAAAAWHDQIRTVDLLARYGGEEFIVLFPNTALDAAAEILDRMQAVTPFDQTFSCGLAQWNGVETSDELITRADATLYDAKDAGRHRVAIAPRTVHA